MKKYIYKLSARFTRPFELRDQTENDTISNLALRGINQLNKPIEKVPLIRLTQTWRAELDSKKIFGVLSSDMSKGFDSLSPKLLINKLRAYNFCDKAIQLIRSYFQGRENRVRMGSVTSDWVVVKRGCPQGSTFGLLMWNIFQNDMPNIISDANVSMYPDDHRVFVAKEQRKAWRRLCWTMERG